MEDRTAGQVKVIGALAVCMAALPALAMPAQDCERLGAAVKTGDLIFRAEDSLISRLVMHAQGDGRFSHVGLIVEQAGGPRVFHAEYDPAKDVDGVVSDDLCAFVRRALRIEVRRPQGQAATDSRALSRIVERIGFPRFNLAFREDPGDGSVYCTQYVWRVLAAANVIIGLPRRPGLITVPNLLDAPELRFVARWEGGGGELALRAGTARTAR